MNERDSVSSRLPRAVLRTRHDILSSKCVRNGFLLDRRRGFISHFVDSLKTDKKVRKCTKIQLDAYQLQLIRETEILESRSLGGGNVLSFDTPVHVWIRLLQLFQYVCGFFFLRQMGTYLLLPLRTSYGRFCLRLLDLRVNFFHFYLNSCYY